MFKIIKNQIPNAVTLSRLFVFLPLIIINLVAGNVPLALTFFVAGALTDTIDGTLARKLNAVSGLGETIDPIVDIWFGVGTLFTLTFFNPVMVVPLVFEAAKTINGMHIMAKTKKRIKVSREGKRKTVILGITTAIGFGAIINPLIMNILLPAVALTALLQVRTINGYAKILKAHETKTESEEKPVDIIEEEKVPVLSPKNKRLSDKFRALRKEAKSCQDFIYQELGLVDSRGEPRKLK